MGDGTHIPVKKNNKYFENKYVFGQIESWFLKSFKINVCEYYGLKYVFCESFYKIGLIDFALAMCLHNENNNNTTIFCS